MYADRAQWFSITLMRYHERADSVMDCVVGRPASPRRRFCPPPPQQTGFATQTRGEISNIAWHWVEDLPFRRDPSQQREAGEPKYYMVQQFVGQLRRWIGEQRKAGKGACAREPTACRPPTVQAL